MIGERVENATTISYNDIPDFPRSTGKCIFLFSIKSNMNHLIDCYLLNKSKDIREI
jgi:hypothetical protein